MGAQAGGAGITVAAARRGAAGRLAKRLGQAFFALAVLPRLAVCRAMAAIVGRDAAFQSASESIARLPGLRGVYSRQAFYRRTLAGCGRDVYFGWGSVFSKRGAAVGDGAYIGRRCSVGLADIGAGALLADGVQVLSGARQHGLAAGDTETHRDQPQRFERVIVGEAAWIGANAVVMADVGRGAVIGAGAVVSRPVPERSIALGVPARVVRRIEAAE